MLVAGGHEKVLRSRSSWIAGDTVGRGGLWTAYLRSLEAFGPQDMLELPTSQEPLHNSKKDGAGGRVLSAKSGNGLSTSRGEGRKALAVWGAVLRFPSSHLAPTGGWYRQVPTAHCHPAPPPSGARGGGTGGLRRPKLGSVPGGLLGVPRGGKRPARPKSRTRNMQSHEDGSGGHRPTGRGAKGADARSLEEEGRRPGRPDVGSAGTELRDTSTRRGKSSRIHKVTCGGP
jgi:hypothetical protein